MDKLLIIILGKRQINKLLCCVSGRRVTHENLVLSNELIKVELPLRKIWKKDFSSISPQSELIIINVSEKIVSFPLTKGLCLRLWLFIIFHSGNLNFINSLDKTKSLYTNVQ